MNHVTRCSAVFIAIVLAAVSDVRGDDAVHRPYPGIVCRAEVRSDPPMHLVVAEIDLAHPKFKLRVSPGGPDPDGAGEWETTLMAPSKVAEREGFLLTVNGDFFTVKDGNELPGALRYRPDVWAGAVGPAVTDGKVWSVAKKKLPCLLVRKKGVTIENVDRPPADALAVVAGNVMLVEEGQPVVHENIAKHPRTVVGLDENSKKLTILVVDGRRPGISEGMSYAELSRELIRRGCRRGLNLDGGGSSVMILRDPSSKELRVLNNPSDGRERPVANVLGIAQK